MSVPVIPFDIPHRGNATYENQSKLDRIDFAIILWAAMGWAWESACAVTPNQPSDLTVHVAAGSVLFDGVSTPSPAGAVTTLPDAANPRFALVGVDRLATASYTRAGTTVTMKLAVDPTIQGWVAGQSINVVTNSGAANVTGATIIGVTSNGDGTGNITYTNGSGTITTTAAVGFVVHVGVWHGAVQPTADKPAFPAIPAYGAIIVGSVYLPPAVAVLSNQEIIDKRVPFKVQGGGGGGAVISVNAQTGAVVLTYTDVGAQQASTVLASIAALNTTPYGRSVLEQANQGALRTYLGLGTSAPLNVGNTAGTVARGDDPRFVTVSAGTLYGGDAPYFMNPTRSPDQIAAAIVQLLTDGAAQGRKVVFPGYGPANPMRCAPWAVTIAGDRYIAIEGQGQAQTVLLQAQSGAGAWTLPFTPVLGGAVQDYWFNVNGNTSDGSIIFERMSLIGGHSQKPSPQDAESAWATYGIGIRAGRRVTFRDLIIGGFRRGMQFDGQLDHNDFQRVQSQGNWDNVYFGPRSAVKDSTFYACTFSSASRASIAIDPNGLLSGSSFYGCHLGTAPYGIYIATGAKPGTALMMQDDLFAETVWEGCGNYRIFCEDGDSRLDRLSFELAQFHGLEAGDNANPNGSQHMFFCASITNIARASTGIVTITVTNGAASKIEAGQYITINGDTTTLPPPGPLVSGVEDPSLKVPLRVISRTGNTIVAQGTSIVVVASAPCTGFVSRIGMFRAGQITKLRGNGSFDPDEIKTRDPVYGYPAELYVDVDDHGGWDYYDGGHLFNVQCRSSRHLDTRLSRMRTESGTFFLGQVGGAITAAQKPAVVTMSGANGDMVLGVANRESAGVVGGTASDHSPVSPGGAWLAAGDYAWVQEEGVATVRGAPAAAGGQTLVAGATGQATALAAGTAPGTSDFEVGKAVGPNIIKL